MKTATAPAGSPPSDIAGGGTATGNANAVELVWPGEDQLDLAPMVRRGILLCREGQIVARPSLAPPDAPADPNSSSLRLGPGVAWDAARSAYIACRNGHVRLVQNRLDVNETLDWPKDLDAGTGPFTFEGDIIVRRGVLDLAMIRSSRDVIVFDCVEAANIDAVRDITVHHGICGKEKGIVRAGGCVSARFLSNARIVAGGDVIVEKEIDNSRVQCGGELRVEQGTILAGHVNATVGIHCHTAGSKSGVRTILELGISAEQQAEAQRLSDALAAKRHKAQEIRSIVEPLMASQKSLTAAQKEKATELLFVADQFEVEAKDLDRKIEVLDRPRQVALGGVIRVASKLFPGVIIRFPEAQARAPEGLRCPVTMRLKTEDGQRKIVAVDDCRGTEVPLLPLASVERPLKVS